MPTRVVNIAHAPCDVYVGRAGRGLDGYFGNPYRVGDVCAGCGQRHATGGSTLPCYRKYFAYRLDRDAEFRRRVLGLRGKTLGCFCAPHPCHGDVIAGWVDAQPEE